MMTTFKPFESWCLVTKTAGQLDLHAYVLQLAWWMVVTQIKNELSSACTA